MRTSELVAALDHELDAHSFADGQENGLQVEGRRDIEAIVAAVSVNRATIDAAIERGADALLTHHGLMWNSDPGHVRGVKRARLGKLLEADLNLITYHLPLDAHPTLGNNAGLAEAAGLADAAPAFPHKGRPIGMAGALPSRVPFAEWIKEFEARLRDGCTVPTGPFQVWPFGRKEIRTVGFVSGAAPYQLQTAIDMGLDVYVTGEVTEPMYHLAKEAGIHFVAGGHYLTERLGIQRLGAWIDERFGIEVRCVDVATEA